MYLQNFKIYTNAVMELEMHLGNVDKEACYLVKMGLTNEYWLLI